MIILNEKEYADERLRKQDIGENPLTTIRILARYYYHEMGFKNKTICDLLKEFIKSAYPRYTSSIKEWNDTIEHESKNASQQELIEIDGIWITSTELSRIHEINNIVLEKLAFTLLCLAKFNNIKKPDNNNWVNIDAKNIFNMAGIKCTKKVKANYIGDLIRYGIIRYANQIDNLNIQVLFVDESNDNTLLVSDFRELGNEYLLYTGEDYIRCAECGRLIKNNSTKTRKYCDNCSSSVEPNTKVVTCVDCGKAIIVSASNKRTCRCIDCQDKYKKERDRIRKNRIKITQDS